LLVVILGHIERSRRRNIRGGVVKTNGAKFCGVHIHNGFDFARLIVIHEKNGTAILRANFATLSIALRWIMGLIKQTKRSRYEISFGSKTTLTVSVWPV
jgi:hypothetical protein